MVLDICNSNFHSIFLHSSIEYFILDAINIRKSLCHMIKYILNKKVERCKANNVNDFKGIGKAAWDFILLLQIKDLRIG